MKFTKYLKRKVLKKEFKKKLQYSKTLGTDGITVNKFQSILDDEIDIIKRKVKNSTYRFSRYKEKLILKGKDKLPRVIQIPTHRDKLLLNALNSFIKDKFKDKVFDSSNIHRRITDIKNQLTTSKYDSFIKIDIENFYPTINHDILLDKVSEVVDDEKALYILQKAIENDTGIAQGLSVSNILASIYMLKFDEKYLNLENISYYRYVDDILILCNSSDIEVIKQSLKEDIEKLDLKMHPFGANKEKSAVGLIEIEQLQYLGFEFFNQDISIRDTTIEKFQQRIIDLFKEHKKLENKDFYEKLNLKITGCVYNNKQYGWLYFFSMLNDLTLTYKLDHFVKKCCKQFGRKYDENKIKTFHKTYYKLKSLDTSKLNDKSYIPKFTKTNKNVIGFNLDLIESYSLDIDYY
jgi:retron-type reverse transcriptase